MSQETPLTLEENPFAPGPGRMPPVLAGRETEQTQLRTCLLRLQNGKEVNPTLLSAPRGMGKTVLLRWLQQQARAAKVEMLEISANEARTLLDLTSLLAPKLLEAVSVSRIRARPLKPCLSTAVSWWIWEITSGALAFLPWLTMYVN